MSDYSVTPEQKAAWRCPRCKSKRSVGYGMWPNSGPVKAQCVPCGNVSDWPKIEPEDEQAHKPCCGSCGGSGGSYGEVCWDCRGTGCAHPPQPAVDRVTEALYQHLVGPDGGAGLDEETLQAFHEEAERYTATLQDADLIPSPERDARIWDEGYSKACDDHGGYDSCGKPGSHTRSNVNPYLPRGKNS